MNGRPARVPSQYFAPVLLIANCTIANCKFYRDSVCDVRFPHEVTLRKDSKLCKLPLMIHKMRGVAFLMSAVFFLMSACLLIQLQAASDDVPSCHASTRDQKIPDQKFEMGRCCQAGILKSEENCKVEMHDLQFASLPVEQSGLSVFYEASTTESHPALFRRTSVRLAELSLLRL